MLECTSFPYPYFQNFIKVVHIFLINWESSVSEDLPISKPLHCRVDSERMKGQVKPALPGLPTRLPLAGHCLLPLLPFRTPAPLSLSSQEIDEQLDIGFFLALQYFKQLIGQIFPVFLMNANILVLKSCYIKKKSEQNQAKDIGEWENDHFILQSVGLWSTEQWAAGLPTGSWAGHRPNEWGSLGQNPGIIDSTGFPRVILMQVVRNTAAVWCGQSIHSLWNDAVR